MHQISTEIELQNIKKPVPLRAQVFFILHFDATSALMQCEHQMGSHSSTFWICVSQYSQVWAPAAS